MSVGGKADLRGGAGAGLSIRWGDKSKPAAEYKCLPTCLRNTVIYRTKFCPRQLEIERMSGGNYFVMFFTTKNNGCSRPGSFTDRAL